MSVLYNLLNGYESKLNVSEIHIMSDTAQDDHKFQLHLDIIFLLEVDKDAKEPSQDQ